MTEDQAAEWGLFQLATPDTRKFALEIGLTLAPARQAALERMQIAEQIRLIDVGQVAAAPGRVMRIFRVTEAGYERYLALKAIS